VWKGYEPDEAAVRRLIARVDASVDRNTVWAHRLSKIRTGSAAAACIVLGVLIGRVTFSSHEAADGGIPGATRVEARGGGTPRIIAAPHQQGGPVQFRIVDGNGTPITLQPFSSQKDADDFLLDLARWQHEQEQLRQSGTTMPSSGKF
jgi:hypothetical protein